jgi:hypothetical protein
MNLIPEGTWRARGVSAALGYTSTDNEQIGVELQFLGDQDDDVDGRHTTWYASFSEKAEVHTLKALRVLGWSGDDLSDLSGIDANEVEAVVVHEEDLQGELRAKVRFINPVGAGGVAMKTKMSEDQAKAFAARMKGRVLALSKAAPPAAAAKPAAGGKPAAKPAAKPAGGKPKNAAAVQPPESDDVPF